MENILAIGAHFDDVELGVGGTLARLANEGKKVYKITLTDNVTKFTKFDVDVAFKESRQESLLACKKLNIVQIEPKDYARCTELDFSSESMQAVEEVIFENNIDTVFTHFQSDIQQDHVEASKIGFVAGRYCKNRFFYQSNRYVLPTSFYPRCFFDISSTIELKKEALNCYTGNHDRFQQLFDQTIKQNSIWGYQSQIGSTNSYAEGFVPLKMVL